jgi:hypothetical protein
MARRRRKSGIKIKKKNRGKLRKTSGRQEGQEDPGVEAAQDEEVEEPEDTQARELRPQRAEVQEARSEEEEAVIGRVVIALLAAYEQIRDPRLRRPPQRPWSYTIL